VNETDFEERLRGHLAAKARLIEVPDHKFVQTKVVPFQPRRNRFNNLAMAAAGAAIVAMLGFGLIQTTGNNDEAGIIPTRHASCDVTVIAGSDGYWLTATTSRATIGPFSSDQGQNLTVDGGPPVIFKVFDSEGATEPIAETTMTRAGGTCNFEVTVSDSSGALQFDVSAR